jgi:hypothetical protein
MPPVAISSICAAVSASTWLEQHERAVAGEPAAQFRERHVEQFRERRPGGCVEDFRIRPDLEGFEADGENRAVAVDDAPAHGVEFERALIALLPLLDVEIVIDDLHPERAAASAANAENVMNTMSFERQAGSFDASIGWRVAVACGSRGGLLERIIGGRGASVGCQSNDIVNCV